MVRCLCPGGLAPFNVAALDVLHGSHSTLTMELRRLHARSLRTRLETAGLRVETMSYTTLQRPAHVGVRAFDRWSGRVAKASDADLQVPAAPVNALLDLALARSAGHALRESAHVHVAAASWRATASPRALLSQSSFSSSSRSSSSLTASSSAASAFSTSASSSSSVASSRIVGGRPKRTRGDRRMPGEDCWRSRRTPGIAHFHFFEISCMRSRGGIWISYRFRQVAIPLLRLNGDINVRTNYPIAHRDATVRDRFAAALQTRVTLLTAARRKRPTRPRGMPRSSRSACRSRHRAGRRRARLIRGLRATSRAVLVFAGTGLFGGPGTPGV